MNSITSIAVSGMHAAQAQLAASAHNIANLATPGFKRQTVQVASVPEGGVKTAVSSAPTAGAALEEDVVQQLQAKNSFMANLAVFKTRDRTMGALLDTRS
jgi:flagellar basal body rod protein FlgG